MAVVVVEVMGVMVEVVGVMVEVVAVMLEVVGVVVKVTICRHRGWSSQSFDVNGGGILMGVVELIAE